MLTRCFRAAALASNGPAFSRMIRGFSTAKKDYYDILGLNRDASQEEIKTAYRNLAKRYHPDVNASGEAYEGDAEKFRLVVEAYQVLNVPESRTAYDLQNQSAPESIYRAQRMEQQRKYHARGKDGQPIKEGYAPGSYAESKRKFLADERKKFNVGPTGRYKGGVPQKGKGVARGTAFDAPGAYHDPLLHNIKLNPDPDSQFVTSRDALAFKHYMMEEKYSLRKRWTWFQAKVDFDFWKLETYKEGYRWIRNLLILAFGISGIAQLMVQAENRSILKQAEKLRGEGNLRAGVKINGRKIKEGETGIIKLV